MLIKALELFLIADVGGPEMDQGSTVRYFSEMVSFPTALLGDSISFEPVDDRSARVALTDGGDAASAVTSDVGSSLRSRVRTGRSR